MPLVKRSLQPAAAAPVAAPAPVAQPGAVAEQPRAAVASQDIQPKDLDRKSREIQRQGAFQAALQSVGVVQHGGKTFDDYLNRVRQAADAELAYINAR